MYVYIVIAATLSIVRANPSTSTRDLTFNCRVINDLIDKAVTDSNFQMKNEGQDNMLVDTYGFDAEVNLYAFGWKLPVAVSLSVSDGNLTGIDTMKRASDATDCSTPIIRTLEGLFDYGPELSMMYSTARAKFLFWEAHGKFVYKPKPRMHVALLNSAPHLDFGNCRFESIASETPGRSEYVFETENTWKGWVISKLLALGLEQNDETSMKLQVDLWSQGEIAAYFSAAWCAIDFGSPGHA